MKDHCEASQASLKGTGTAKKVAIGPNWPKKGFLPIGFPK